MSKTLVIIGFLILLIIGGKILFPQKMPENDVQLNSMGDTEPAKAVMFGPTTPPAPHKKISPK